METKSNNLKGRVIAVDVLRGMAVCLMLFVDNTVGNPFELTRHHMWNGLTPPDFAFPTFITLMGVSIYFSLSKFGFKASGASVFRILRRFVLLCIFGWCVARINTGINAVFEGNNFFEAALDFSNWRVMGVFTRIALCYLFGSLIVLFIHNKKLIIALVIILLLGYSVVLSLYNGYEQSEANIISVIDKVVFSPDHMYHMKTYSGDKILLDPEGLLSTIPAIAQTLIGFLVGSIFRNEKMDAKAKVIRMLVIGLALLLVGCLSSPFVPTIKKVWSASFVLITCGVDIFLLSVFAWLIDVKGHNKWCKFFQVYGSNALISFASLDILWATLKLSGLATIVYEFFVPVCFGVGGVASLMTSLVYIILWWFVLYFLDKKKIYIRL